MANSYGANGNPAADNVLMPGTRHDAAVRAIGNIWNLADDTDAAGGTSNGLVIGRVRAGSVIQPEFKIASDVDVDGVTFKLGTLTDDDKYASGLTGPNAATVSGHILPVMQNVVLTEDETLVLTPSGALPATGTISATVNISHR